MSLPNTEVSDELSSEVRAVLATSAGQAALEMGYNQDMVARGIQAAISKHGRFILSEY